MNNKGSVAVIFVFLLPLIIITVAFVLDLGNLLFLKLKFERSLKFAGISVTRSYFFDNKHDGINNDINQINTVAKNFFKANFDIENTSINVTDLSDKMIKIEGEKTFPLLFGNVMLSGQKKVKSGYIYLMPFKSIEVVILVSVHNNPNLDQIKESIWDFIQTINQKRYIDYAAFTIVPYSGMISIDGNEITKYIPSYDKDIHDNIPNFLINEYHDELLENGTVSKLKIDINRNPNPLLYETINRQREIRFIFNHNLMPVIGPYTIDEYDFKEYIDQIENHTNHKNFSYENNIPSIALNFGFNALDPSYTTKINNLPFDIDKNDNEKIIIMIDHSDLVLSDNLNPNITKSSYANDLDDLMQVKGKVQKNAKLVSRRKSKCYNDLFATDCENCPNLLYHIPKTEVDNKKEEIDIKCVGTIQMVSKENEYLQKYSQIYENIADYNIQTKREFFYNLLLSNKNLLESVLEDYNNVEEDSKIAADEQYFYKNFINKNLLSEMQNIEKHFITSEIEYYDTIYSPSFEDTTNMFQNTIDIDDFKDDFKNKCAMIKNSNIKLFYINTNDNIDQEKIKKCSSGENYYFTGNDIQKHFISIVDQIKKTLPPVRIISYY